MLRKLIAYDFRCVRKTALLLFALSLGVALVATTLWALTFGALPEMAFSEDVGIGEILLFMAGMFGGFFATIGALVSASAVIFVIGIHYYKKFVSDEAYLTFTLPATPGQHLASKLITGGIWMTASFIVLIVEMIMIFVPLISLMMKAEGMGADVDVDMGSAFFPKEHAGALIAMIIGYLFTGLAATANQIALLYFSLTMGGIVVSKYKALAGVGIYFVAEFVIESIVQGIIAVLNVAGMLTMGDLALTLLPYISVLIYGAFATGFILFNKHLLTHKLNLS